MTLAFVVAVVATPLGAWPFVAVESVVVLFAVILSGAPLRPLLRRLIGLGGLAVFLAVVLAAGHPLREGLGFGPLVSAIVARNVLALTAVLTLAGSFSPPRLLDALSRLGVPAPLVETLYFMERFRHILADELRRMTTARRARSFRRSGRLAWPALGGLLGGLFLRAMERGHRVRDAMIARGWDGRLRLLDGEDRS